MTNCAGGLFFIHISFAKACHVQICHRRLKRLPPAGHRLAAVHHQQPQAGDRAVQGRRGGLDARAQCAPGRAARRMAGRDHRGLAAWDKANPDKPAAPFAINQIVHKSNDRLEHDMALCAKYKVPIVITSWARART
jgi:hypothetical protein